MILSKRAIFLFLILLTTSGVSANFLLALNKMRSVHGLVLEKHRFVKNM